MQSLRAWPTDKGSTRARVTDTVQRAAFVPLIFVGPHANGRGGPNSLLGPMPTDMGERTTKLIRLLVAMCNDPNNGAPVLTQLFNRKDARALMRYLIHRFKESHDSDGVEPRELGLPGRGTARSAPDVVKIAKRLGTGINMTFNGIIRMVMSILWRNQADVVAQDGGDDDDDNEHNNASLVRALAHTWVMDREDALREVPRGDTPQLESIRQNIADQQHALLRIYHQDQCARDDALARACEDHLWPGGEAAVARVRERENNRAEAEARSATPLTEQDHVDAEVRRDKARLTRETHTHRPKITVSLLPILGNVTRETGEIEERVIGAVVAFLVHDPFFDLNDAVERVFNTARERRVQARKAAQSGRRGAAFVDPYEDIVSYVSEENRSSYPIFNETGHWVYPAVAMLTSGDVIEKMAEDDGVDRSDPRFQLHNLLTLGNALAWIKHQLGNGEIQTADSGLASGSADDYVPGSVREESRAAYLHDAVNWCIDPNHWQFDPGAYVPGYETLERGEYNWPIINGRPFVLPPGAHVVPTVIRKSTGSVELGLDSFYGPFCEPTVPRVNDEGRIVNVGVMEMQARKRFQNRAFLDEANLRRILERMPGSRVDLVDELRSLLINDTSVLKTPAEVAAEQHGRCPHVMLGESTAEVHRCIRRQLGARAWRLTERGVYSQWSDEELAEDVLSAPLEGAWLEALESILGEGRARATVARLAREAGYEGPLSEFRWVCAPLPSASLFAYRMVLADRPDGTIEYVYRRAIATDLVAAGLCPAHRVIGGDGDGPEDAVPVAQMSKLAPLWALLSNWRSPSGLLWRLAEMDRKPINDILVHTVNSFKQDACATSPRLPPPIRAVYAFLDEERARGTERPVLAYPLLGADPRMEHWSSLVASLHASMRALFGTTGEPGHQFLQILGLLGCPMYTAERGRLHFLIRGVKGTGKTEFLKVLKALSVPDVVEFIDSRSKQGWFGKGDRYHYGEAHIIDEGGGLVGDTKGRGAMDGPGAEMYKGLMSQNSSTRVRQQKDGSGLDQMDNVKTKTEVHSSFFITSNQPIHDAALLDRMLLIWQRYSPLSAAWIGAQITSTPDDTVRTAIDTFRRRFRILQSGCTIAFRLIATGAASLNMMVFDELARDLFSYLRKVGVYGDGSPRLLHKFRLLCEVGVVLHAISAAFEMPGGMCFKQDLNDETVLRALHALGYCTTPIVLTVYTSLSDQIVDTAAAHVSNTLLGNLVGDEDAAAEVARCPTALHAFLGAFGAEQAVFRCIDKRDAVVYAQARVLDPADATGAGAEQPELGYINRREEESVTDLNYITLAKTLEELAMDLHNKMGRSMDLPMITVKLRQLSRETVSVPDCTLVESDMQRLVDGWEAWRRMNGMQRGAPATLDDVDAYLRAAVPFMADAPRPGQQGGGLSCRDRPRLIIERTQVSVLVTGLARDPMTSFRKSLDIFRKRTHRDWGHVVTGLTLDGSPYPETVHVAPMRPDQAPTLFNVRALAPQAARVAGMANGPLDAEAGAAAWANEAHDGFIGRRMHGQRMRTVYGPGGEAWSMEHLAAHDVWARSGHGASRRPQTPAVLAAAREEWLAEHPSTKRMLQKHAVEYPNDLMAGYNRLRDRLVQGGADDDSNVEIIDPAALPDVTQQRTLRSPRRGTPPNADRRSEGHRTASIARALAKRGPATAVDQHDQAGPRKQPRAH